MPPPRTALRSLFLFAWLPRVWVAFCPVPAPHRRLVVVPKQVLPWPAPSPRVLGSAHPKSPLVSSWFGGRHPGPWLFLSLLKPMSHLPPPQSIRQVRPGSGPSVRACGFPGALASPYSNSRSLPRLGPWPGQLKSWTEEAEEPRGLAPWTTPSFLTVPCVMCPACRLPVWAESIVRNPSWDETSDITPASATCKIPPQPRGRPAHSHETGWTQRLWTWAAPCEEGVCPPQLPLQ
nr:hypothetical protein HJG59_008110 [Molossus molossus]